MSFKHLKYYPELNKLTGSVNATIVLLQLEYWFAKCGGGRFYKFLEACEHERYKPGDSWTEELGFTKCEFRGAFSKIGKVYKSKNAFKASKDIFEGKCYASYYDRTKGLTYYIRNDEALAELFAAEVSFGKASEEVSVNQENTSPISVEYSKSLPEVKDTHTAVKGTQMAVGIVPYETIKELFNTSCPSYPKVTDLTPKRRTMLYKLWQRMRQSLEHFKKAFILAEASDFLTGRIGAWRASFDWLIQEDKFIALLEGNYENRQASSSLGATLNNTKSAPSVNKSKFTSMYTHNWNFEELEALENKYIDEKINQLKASALTAKGVCHYGQI